MAKAGWHPIDIKAAIHKRKGTLTQIALDAGLASSACRRALIERYAPAEKAISDFLGIAPQVLWPDRYDAQGQPLPRKRRGGRIAAKRDERTVNLRRAS